MSEGVGPALDKSGVMVALQSRGHSLQTALANYTTPFDPKRLGVPVRLGPGLRTGAGTAEGSVRPATESASQGAARPGIADCHRPAPGNVESLTTNRVRPCRVRGRSWPTARWSSARACPRRPPDAGVIEPHDLTTGEELWRRGTSRRAGRTRPGRRRAVRGNRRQVPRHHADPVRTWSGSTDRSFADLDTKMTAHSAGPAWGRRWRHDPSEYRGYGW